MSFTHTWIQYDVKMILQDMKQTTVAFLLHLEGEKKVNPSGCVDDQNCTKMPDCD